MKLIYIILNIKKKKYKLALKDTSGQEKFKSITKNFLRNTDGVLFIYDISYQDSFNGLKSWYKLYKNESKEVMGLLIGNKCDLEQVVNIEEAKKFAEEHGLKYLETSAKSDKNLRKAIACILEKIIKSKENQESEENKKN